LPSFTTPTRLEGSSDFFFGRYTIPVGVSVVLVDGHYVEMPYPWLGAIADLVDGETYFLGGRTYEVSESVANALEADGFTTE
jgi:hypothetical protein